MRISDWSSDVCSSDLCRLAGPCGAFDAARAWRNEGRRFRRYVPADPPGGCAPGRETPEQARHPTRPRCTCALLGWLQFRALWHSASISPRKRSEEHTSELQSLMRISYAVFCLKKKNKKHK